MWNLIVALLIAIVIAGFATLNNAPVSVNLFLWQAPEVSLALVVLISVLIGVVLAALFGTPRYVKTLQKIKELENKIKGPGSGKTKPEEKQLGKIKEEEKHEETKEQNPPQN